MTETAPVRSASEPWMRGTHTELDPLRRGVVHALELALEDAERWTTTMTQTELFECPSGLPSVSFHLTHIARSLDRLLSYAEDRRLSAEQLVALTTEHALTDRGAVLEEFQRGVNLAISRVRSLDETTLPQQRGIGRQRLPTTVGGLLAHCAEHTQRHCGQMITTAKLVTKARRA